MKGFLPISGENASKHLKNLVYLYVVTFEAQNSFHQYLSSFTYLKKKVISDNSELISEIATFCHIMVVLGDFLRIQYKTQEEL